MDEGIRESARQSIGNRLLSRLRTIKRRNWVLMGVLGTTALVSTGLVAFAPEPDRVPADRSALPVIGERVAPGVHSPHLNLFGRVETPHSASLTALVSAAVAGLEAKEGERVAAGAVLVQLDTTDARLMLRRRQAAVAQAEADLEALKLAGLDDAEVLEHQKQLQRLAQNKVQRHRQLREQGSISQETMNAVLQESHAQSIALSRQRNLVDGFEHRLARSMAQLETATAALEEAKVNLERTSIRAPFAGRVTRIAVAPGELVSPGLVVAEIYDDSALEVRVQIPTAHLPTLERALAAGQNPAASVDFGDRRANGALDRLVGAVAKGQSGVDGLVRLEGGARPPDLGRAVNLRITLPPVANAVAVPVPSVYGQRRLFLIEDDLLVGIDIERLGETTTSDGTLKLLVRAPALANGATILSSQLSNAVTGLRVSVAAPEEPSAGASAPPTGEDTA